MKIIATGGRAYKDAAYVNTVLSEIRPTIICIGDARGLDKLVLEWAKAHSCPVKIYKAEWDKYGLAAGPLRNKKMIEENRDAEKLIAFPGGLGTKNCIQQASRAGIAIVLCGVRNG
jgi:hypothetical protein